VTLPVVISKTKRMRLVSPGSGLIGFLVVGVALMRVETSQPSARIRLLRGGTEGNARLTASTGVVLLVLLAVEAPSRRGRPLRLRVARF
jgi:hypothetical protein